MPGKRGTPVGKYLLKYNKGVVDFIIDHIEDGMTLSAICKHYPEQVPTEKMIYTWKKKYPDFKQKIDEAYETFLYKKIDEHEELSKECLELEHKLEEAYKQIGDELSLNSPNGEKPKGKKESKYMQMKMEALRNRDRRDNIRIRLQALQFIISKIMPKLCNDFREARETQQSALPPVTIVTYIQEQKQEPKLIN